MVKDFVFFKFSSLEGVDSVLRDGPWMIREIPLFLNKLSPFVSLLKEELSHVPILSIYARFLIEINDCNDFSDNMVMVIPNHKGTGYSKETIHIKYEWEPPRCCTCLIFGHLLDDCPKSPKRVVNRMDKGKGQTSGDDDEGFIEVGRKKLGGNNGGNKTFKSGLVKQKTLYRPKVKQSAEGRSPSNKGNGFSDDTDLFSLSNSFEALNVENPFIDEVATGIKATCSGMQDERKSSTSLVERINVYEKQILEGKLVLVDDDGNH
ncbi:putative ribonuclease H-like domain-containing protein [Tanacetum coccineum]|uniref:Ribonuclease H-like domain-containing protein n=1 Tax=Tanacetum coccineum TaxID=301880 RepID=A0ABQ4Z9R8_9ASTR